MGKSKLKCKFSVKKWKNFVQGLYCKRNELVGVKIVSVRKLWNELFYGPKIRPQNRREGGLYYVSEQALGGHTFKTKVAFALLEDCAREGSKSIKKLKEEREFLNEFGRDLCNFLKLDHISVIQGIETIWSKTAGKCLEIRHLNIVNGLADRQ